MTERSGWSQRLWSQLPDGTRQSLSELAPTDLQSLLLEVSRARAQQVTPARLMRRWTEDRLVRPSSVDPRLLSALEAQLWEMLPADFDGIELSPVVPLGSCAAVGAADQNRVLSTVRNNEVVSDPTNALALEVARRRTAGDGLTDVHLATCQRILRPQTFAPGFSSHFKLFALASGGRDRGASVTEGDLLLTHLSFWRSVLESLVPSGEWMITYSTFDDPGLAKRIRDVVQPALGAVQGSFVEDPQRSRGKGYYTSGAILISAVRNGEQYELGDGGFTDWTARLTMNAKERCLISCLSTERLLEIAGRRDGL